MSIIDKIWFSNTGDYVFILNQDKNGKWHVKTLQLIDEVADIFEDEEEALTYLQKKYDIGYIN